MKADLTYRGIVFHRNARGGLVAPQPGGHEREYGIAPDYLRFDHPLYGYPATIAWRRDLEAYRATDAR